jgi:cytochrome c-type biogenesis protein CcmH/NrfF
VDVDWSFMEEWGGPVALILLGLILVISHVRRKRNEHASGVGMPPRSY